jgi:hypothetical protein
MTAKAAHDDYTQRIVNAIHATPERERGAIFPRHTRAFRIIEAVHDGLIRPDGLTDDGTAAVDALAAQVKVPRVVAPEPAKSGKS